MNRINNICRLHYLTCAFLCLLTACGGPRDSRSGAEREYRTVYSAELARLDYLVSSTVAEMAVAVNAVSPLVEHDPYGVIRPSAAKHWTVSDDGLVYTFTLRKGQMWYTWDQQEYAELVAQDFVDAMEHVLDPATASFSAHHIRGIIKQADAYFLSRSDPATPPMDFEQVGIRAKDRYVVEYTLETPTPWFLSLLTHTVYRPVNGRFLRETGERFGTDHRTFLSCGPFILVRHEPQNSREFVKNPHYWDRDHVHIDRLVYRFNREATTLAPELFYRGEISDAQIPIAIIDGWMADPARKQLVFPQPVNAWNFFFSFNFNPRFPATYEPENWRLAVQNKHFRQAFYHGLDRVAAHLTVDPFQPERQLKNTLTSPHFVAVHGVDYTLLPPLLAFTENDPFDPERARQHAIQARRELEGQVSFPVKVKVPFNTGQADAIQRVQVIEQQLERLLGADFIDILPVGYPPSGYLDNTRRNGNYAFAEVNWGPTYLDPYAYTPPFHTGNPVSFTDISLVAGDTYQTLLDQAHAEKHDIARRYLLLAEAEAYLLDEALVIPYRGGGGGYGASHIEPFTKPFAAAGLCHLGFKYARLRGHPFTRDEFHALEQTWENERRLALQSAQEPYAHEPTP